MPEWFEGAAAGGDRVSVDRERRRLVVRDQAGRSESGGRSQAGAALEAPTTPVEEAAFLAEFDAIERETAEVDAALRKL
jgi:hypothetical protein